MGNSKRDNKSGGLIFNRTEDEKSQMKILRNYKKQQKDIEDLKQQIEYLKTVLINKIEEK